MGICGATRKAVSWSIVFGPGSRKNCLGDALVLSGHRRVPLPPARIEAYIEKSPLAQEVIIFGVTQLCSPGKVFKLSMCMHCTKRYVHLPSSFFAIWHTFCATADADMAARDR